MVFWIHEYNEFISKGFLDRVLTQTKGLFKLKGEQKILEEKQIVPYLLLTCNWQSMAEIHNLKSSK